jgi:murein DD-endopeptidase MepM/ murein hydrolase activator NlpD
VNIVVVLLSLSVHVPVVAASSQSHELSVQSTHPIPDFLSPFGAYPNSLQLTDAHRATFHPVLLVLKGISPQAVDYRNAKGLASSQAIWKAKECRPCRWLTRFIQKFRQKRYWALGRYDENRQDMYTSELFQNLENHIDGYSGRRTVHLGIDLGAPIGTKVHAFTDGMVHSVGYNAEHGDYGYVVVIQHALPSGVDVWALYGHLDQSTIKGKTPGSRIRRGQVIGRIGACHEKGGLGGSSCSLSIVNSST